MYPVVVVKSSRSPCEYYEQALAELGDKQICEGAVTALQLLEDDPASVVVIEADTDDMSGIEFVEAIRDIDAESGHFTFLVITSNQMSADIQAAFTEHVEAWVPADQGDMLAATVRAGIRIAERMNELWESNRILLAEREGLIKGQLLDPLTGLGNRRYAEQALSDSARQIESRGGALCFLMIAVGNYEIVRQEYDDRIAGELIVAVSKRLRQLVRPMDIVTYFAPGQFALVLLQPTIEQCSAECYQRIFDGVRLKSYKTPVGYVDTQIGMSICASLAETGAPNIENMIETAAANLPEALKTQTISVAHINVE